MHSGFSLITENIKILHQIGFSAYIHCSKIHSLLQSFKSCYEFLSNQHKSNSEKFSYYSLLFTNIVPEIVDACQCVSAQSSKIQIVCSPLINPKDCNYSRIMEMWKTAAHVGGEGIHWYMEMANASHRLAGTFPTASLFRKFTHIPIKTATAATHLFIP